MPATVFSKILQQAEAQGVTPNRTSDARNWFRDEANKLTSRNVNVNRIVTGSGDRLTNKILPGRMYMFFYDAKHKGTLPYWDKFPLIFPIESRPDGFLGINLHYLPPALRARLMDSLYELSNNQKYDDTTRLRLSYDLLKGVSKYKYFKPCVKHYLNSQVRSRFVYISPPEWDIALFLPTERFVGTRKTKVWTESRKQILGAR